MPFALDLSLDQSRRTLNQAVRFRSEVVLEPRNWSSGESLTTVLRGDEHLLLLLEVAEIPDRSLTGLIGVHADARMTHGSTQYLFDTHVVDYEVADERPLLFISRPEVLRVAQRRRFHRMMLRPGCEVHMDSIAAPWSGPFVGELLNLSADGLACRVTRTAAQQMGVGDTMHVAFRPGDGDCDFTLEAILRNKTQAGGDAHVILGMHFLLAPSDIEAQATRRRLCDFLYSGSQAQSMQESQV